MEILWAGWRAGYVRSTDEMNAEGCLFCRLPEGDDAGSLILERGPLAYTVLNRFPYTNGHMMVLPHRGVARLDELTVDEFDELWVGVRDGVQAIEDAYAPDGVNVGLNLGEGSGAGVPNHLHVHVLPRWQGDTNFTVTVAETKVLPEALDTSWERVSRSWPQR